MQNRGFTLIELLGVIIVFTALVMIITIASNNAVENSESKLSDIQIKNIEQAASAYYLKEGVNDSYNNRAFKTCVNLSYLIENDYIENEKLIDPKDNKTLDGSVVITYKAEQYSYKYQDNKCTYEYEALESICSAVDKTTVTTGNVPKGKFESGDEYICEVKEGTEYHFFVLSTNENGTINLILDRNINSDGTLATSARYVDWISDSDYGCQPSESETCVSNAKGPITAINFINKAVEDWENIENLNEIYEDENVDEGTLIKGNHGYGSINLTGKARLPKYSEVYGDGKCLTSYENSSQDGSCPLWLVNYLSPSSYVTGDSVENIEFMEGYWTLSSSDGSGWSHHVWQVSSNGYLVSDSLNWANRYGVRPVITVQKLDIAN